MKTNIYILVIISILIIIFLVIKNKFKSNLEVISESNNELVEDIKSNRIINQEPSTPNQSITDDILSNKSDSQKTNKSNSDIKNDIEYKTNITSQNISYDNNWSVNNDKSKVLKSSNTKLLNCPNGIGCECTDDADCINNNCEKHFRAGNVCTLQAGDTFPHFVSVDQFEDIVDIYDFGGQGKYILVEMGATWCSPCNQLAAWLTYGEDDIKSKPFWRDKYNQIYDLIKNNEVIFITVLYEDEFKDNATYETAYEWYTNYPDDLVPILVDKDKLLHGLIKPTGIPAITLLDENMKIINISSRGFNKAFDNIIQIFNSGKNN